jgi:hypothetical protein
MIPRLQDFIQLTGCGVHVAVTTVISIQFQFQFIYLSASLRAHRPITKRARGEKMYTNKKTKAEQ